MRPRLTDWSLAAATGAGLATGISSLVAGRPDQIWIFALHGMAGLWLGLLMWGKLRRVWPRLILPRRWDRWTVLGVLALLLTLSVLSSGVAWSWGGTLVLMGYNLLNWHIAAALLLMLFVSSHMFARARPLRSQDVRGRRPFLRWSALALGAALLWPLQWTAQRARALPGSQRRFTGSREAGSFRGNAFPTSSWVADAPRPIDPAAWRLHITGAVAHPLTLSLADITSDAKHRVSTGDPYPLPSAFCLLPSDLTATLDCTGGFYSTQIWRGPSLGALLDAVGPLPEARWVRISSITGYRWALPLAKARKALLATHVGGEALSHEHGAPLRLIAPGERGFVWVKWVTSVEILTQPDWGALASIYASSVTPEGKGER